MPILPKGGINVAGHKIPWEAIAALAGVAGVILVIRARQSGQTVAAVGQAPSTAAATGFGTAAPVDDSAQLANITQQLTNLSQAIAGSPPTPAPAPPAAATQPAAQLVHVEPVGTPVVVRGRLVGTPVAEITSINT